MIVSREPPDPVSDPIVEDMMFEVRSHTTLRLVVLIAPPKNGLKWFEILHKDILG